jgi:cytohesin
MSSIGESGDIYSHRGVKGQLFYYGDNRYEVKDATSRLVVEDTTGACMDMNRRIREMLTTHSIWTRHKEAQFESDLIKLGERDIYFVTGLLNHTCANRKDFSDPDDRFAYIVKSLLKAGADPNYENSMGFAPIFYNTFSFEITQALVGHGASLKVRDQSGLSLLRHVCDNPQRLQIVLDLGADPKEENDLLLSYLNRTLFRYSEYLAEETAVQQATNAKEIARILLAHGINAPALDEILQNMCTEHRAIYGEMSPAVIQAWKEFVILLLENGAKFRSNDRDTTYGFPLGERGVTALHGAVAKPVAEALLEKGANLNAQDEHGLTPLHTAIGRFSLQTMRTLLERGADPTIKDENGNTPLHTAVHFRNAIAVTTLGDIFSRKRARTEA